MTKTTIIFFLCASAGLMSCASRNQPVQKSNLTAGTIKKSLVKGKTSQAEVVSVLGSPNIVTKNRSGNEVWTYSRQSTESESGGVAGGFLFIGGNKAFSSSASSSFDLIITFDAQDIVVDYSVVQAQF
jgi:outer membrane protein assembly factor BamE (lipoprotein component of BamABCDE complex)